MSRLIKVAILNKSTVVEDDQLRPIVEALQSQVFHDFRATWGITAELALLPKGSPNPQDCYWLGVFDNSDQAGALGYHDLTPQGFPVSKVFAETDLKYGAKLSVTCSHELLEMLGDPFVNLTALDPSSGRLYAYEASDAVEADELGYGINGITVSDFVLPQYFDPQHAGKGVRLSYAGHVIQPFALARGGYLSYLDLNDLKAGWQQETAQMAEGAGGPEGFRQAGFPPGSRRERRVRAAKSELLTSEPVDAEG